MACGGRMMNRQIGKITRTTAATIDHPTLTAIGAGTGNSFSENLRQMIDSVITLHIISHACAPSRLVPLFGLKVVHVSIRKFPTYMLTYLSIRYW